FMAASTITPEYCSLTWSASAGVVISNTNSPTPSFSIATLGTFSIYLTVDDVNGTSTVMNAVTTNTCLDVAVHELNGQLSRLGLFPNPADNGSTINMLSQQDGTVTLKMYD